MDLKVLDSDNSGGMLDTSCDYMPFAKDLRLLVEAKNDGAAEEEKRKGEAPAIRGLNLVQARLTSSFNSLPSQHHHHNYDIQQHHNHPDY